jgi:hypothetical protein
VVAGPDTVTVFRIFFLGYSSRYSFFFKLSGAKRCLPLCGREANLHAKVETFATREPEMRSCAESGFLGIKNRRQHVLRSSLGVPTSNATLKHAVKKKAPICRNVTQEVIRKLEAGP